MGAEPGHARRSGHRRDHPRRGEPVRQAPDHLPRHAGQLPVYYNQIRGQHGDRYADLTQDPAFAFGEGEGYTTFAYGEPTIVGGASNADGTFAQTDTVHAEIALTNTGRRAGTEVVQAYVGDVVTSYSWADRELKAFRRVTLEPGETATVVFDIPVCDCTIADADANRIVEPGEFDDAHRPLVAPRRPQAHHLHRRVNLLCVRCSRVSRSRVNRFRVGLICFRPLRSYAGAGGVVLWERSNDAEY